MNKTLAAVSALSAVLFQSPAFAEAGDFMIRARGVIVAPTESAGSVVPAFPGASVEVNNAFAPELDFTYFLTNNIAVELIAATTKHAVSGTGDLSGLRIGTTRVLPPTLTVQYHFIPDGTIHPYLGAGINYTIFYSEKASGALEDAVGDTDFGISDSVNWALQAGIDIDLSERVFLNLDIKYIKIDTTATLRTDTGSGELVNKVGVDLSPIVAGVGVGYRF